MRRALEACSLALDILAAEAAKQLHSVQEEAGECRYVLLPLLLLWSCASLSPDC